LSITRTDCAIKLLSGDPLRGVQMDPPGDEGLRWQSGYLSTDLSTNI
jgi:hypothetical protein